MDGMDGRDSRLRAAYDAKTGLVAKPTDREVELAHYTNPWETEGFSRLEDSVKAVSPSVHGDLPFMPSTSTFEDAIMSVRAPMAAYHCLGALCIHNAIDPVDGESKLWVSFG